MIITVKVKSKGKIESLIQTSTYGFTAILNVPRQKNEANKQLIKMIANHFGIARSGVKIISGKTGVLKKIRIRER